MPFLKLLKRYEGDSEIYIDFLPMLVVWNSIQERLVHRLGGILSTIKNNYILTEMSSFVLIVTFIPMDTLK